MGLKLTHEYVFNCYASEKYTIHNIYNGSKNKDSLICPVGHEIEMIFNVFQQGGRCIKCCKNILKEKFKLSHKYVFNYYELENYTMKSIYINNKTKDDLICPVGHNIKTTFNSFKKGKRCFKCFGSGKHTHEYVYNFYNNENYKMISIYNGSKNKDQLICPVGHDIDMTFNSFQQGNRCGICFNINNTGKNHYNYNLNREELPLNFRLRSSHPKSWIIKFMKNDPKYQEFILNPDEFVVDHIIPVKLFCELFTKYSLDEQQVKDIINKIDNLQLLTREQNWNKFIKGSSLFEATHYLINNGVPFEKFL
jgi:hypothetical protein